jgi:nucleoside-diphosphate-sugar epimerase
VRVFLTGGTGFIGGEVARLLRGRRDEVHALVRSPAKSKPLEEAGCELVHGDLGDEQALASGMKGCDALIHAAAIYEVGVPRARHEEMWETNVRGTQHVMRAAKSVGVPRIIYVSTIASFGNTRGKVVDETYEHRGDSYTSVYEQTKVDAQRLVRQMMVQGGLPCVIVTPGVVYGPGDRSPIGTLVDRFLAGRLPMMAFPNTGMNFVHRDDAAAGIVLALDRGELGQTYVIGGEITTMGHLIRTLAAVTGRKAPRRTMPTALIKLVAPVGPLVGPALGFPPNLRELIASSDGVTFWGTDEKARRELGYVSRSLEQGLRDTLAARGH